MIRVLVVDDSTFMRNAITALLEQDPEIKVAGTAKDGLEALKKAEELDADVMTLDVEMPRLDGLGTLQRLMKATPMPVLMISSLTESGAESTLKAMEYGALDFIPKNMMPSARNCGARSRLWHAAKRLSVSSTAVSTISPCRPPRRAHSRSSPPIMCRLPAPGRAIW